jgi:hypothetical protein
VSRPQGTNPQSLHVSTGVDGQAILYCFAHQCPAEEICRVLGLSVADLFPDGHHRARHVPAAPMRRSDFRGAARDVADVLYALEQLGEAWQVILASDCPYCEAQGAWLRADSGGMVDADCPEGCDVGRHVGALLGRLRDRKKAGT